MVGRLYVHKDKEEFLGTVIFRLYDEVVPLTVKNFCELAMGIHGYGYQGSSFHRVIPQFMIQGGGYKHADGTLGCSTDGSVLQSKLCSVIFLNYETDLHFSGEL